MSMQKYTATARLLHWISAAVILWAMLTGFYMASLPETSKVRALLSSFNVSLSLAFLPLFLFRLGYALRSQKPAGVQQAAWQQRAAAAAHALLYAVITVVLLSGILMMDHEISVFGLPQLPNPVTDPAWNRHFYVAHRISCMVLFLLITLHLAAVVRHQRAGRRVLARMI